MFCNTLAANHKYAFRDLENLLSAIEMQLCLKPKTFCDFFFYFRESRSNFKHFERKDDRHSYFITKLQAVKDLVRPLSRKNCFRTPFDSEHVKGSQTLVKSA